MNIVAVVFPSLLLLSGVLGSTTPPPFCFSGMLPCGRNARCDATTDRCVCNTGATGDPRVACAGSGRCVCTARADPNFQVFDSPKTDVKVNLPCSVTLVEGGNLGGSCFISEIIAHPETRMEGNRAFVSELEVEMAFPSVSFIVSGSGTELTGGSASEVSFSTSNGFNVATLTAPACSGMTVAVNGTYGAAAAEIPTPTSVTGGLCGNCDGTPESVGSTPASKLAYFLKDIVPTADQRGPHAQVCGQIETTIRFICSDATRRNNAAQVCERYLTDFGICVQNSNSGTASSISTYDAVLQRFNTCLQDVCNGNTAKACTDITNLATSAGCSLPSPAPALCA